MLERRLFKEEHEVFRETFRKFLEKEVVPHQEEWVKNRIVPKEVWKKCGEQGFLCPWVEEKYGGAGADFLYSVVIIEELAKINESGLALSLHSDVCAPYIATYGTEEQKQRWLPGCVSGDYILSVAMTEPGTGSDLAAIRTTAKRDGDYYVINGQKTFISNGINTNLCIVACRTDSKGGHKGMSLIVVEGGTPGFTKGRHLEKVGMHAQDTAELHFDDCRVPASNLLGEEGKGFYYLMEKLQQERLVVAIACQAATERVYEITADYAKTREAFGKPLSKFQALRFKLVEMATEATVSRAFVDRLIEAHMAGKDVVMETCMAKYWTSEMLKKAVDDGVQIHGGYGYMMEYPIAKAYVDARVQTTSQAPLR
jgi:acyl-CoA dehydrogenase